MEGAFAWIGQIIEWLGRFIPRLVLLNPTMGAVKYSGFVFRDVVRLRFGGLRETAHGPGLHVYWPFVSEWDPYPTARQTYDLRSQVVTTSDGRTIALGGMITIEVFDLLLLLPKIDGPTKAIKDISLTAIHDVASKMAWDTLRDEQKRGTLVTKLKNEAARSLRAYGINVIKLQLTDLSPVRVLKMIQAVSKDEE